MEEKYHNESAGSGIGACIRFIWLRAGETVINLWVQ